MQHLHVAHVTNSFRADGTGITDLIKTLSIEQSRMGDRVSIICRDSDQSIIDEMRTLEVDVVVDRNTSIFERNPGPRRVLRDVDIIHCHTVKALLYVAQRAPLSWPRNIVSTIHNPYSRSAVLMHLVRLPVSLSSAEAQAWRKLNRRSVFIPNGNLFGPLALAVENGERLLPGKSVVYVGGLSLRKGTDILLDSWPAIVASVPEATLHIVGNRDNPEMERKAALLRASRSVVFEGFHANPLRYMRDAEVFVLPSRGEGFPLVLAQVRQYGVPIVATDVGGTRDALDGGAAGLLVPPDPSALADATISVLQDKELRDKLAEASSQNVHQFASSLMAERYRKEYLGLLNR